MELDISWSHLVQLIPLSQLTDMMIKTDIAMMMTIMDVMVMITKIYGQ